MPLHKAITLTIAAPISNGICLSQMPAGGGVQNLNLNGSLVSNGVANLDANRRISITSSGNDTAATFTIIGFDYNNRPISEQISGPNSGSVSSVHYFKIVTGVTVSQNTAGNITVGTNQQASSKWYPMNYNRFPVSSQTVNLSTGANLNYTVQFTADNLQASSNASITALPQDHATLANQTSSDAGTLIAGVCGVRIIFNSWTSGSATLNIIQSSATKL